jgi:hypothetical protein
MLIVGGVVDEVDFPQELLLMVLELTHHLGDSLVRICDQREVL